MNITNLFPTLRKLSRADKLKVMQFLITELAKEEDIQLRSGGTYSVTSPYNSHEAVHKLGALLEKDKKNNDVPLLLGRMNFFLEFDVCFYTSLKEFELTQR